MLSNILSLIICILSIGILLFLIANVKTFALIFIFLILLAILTPQDFINKIIKNILKYPRIIANKVIKNVIELIIFF